MGANSSLVAAVADGNLVLLKSLLSDKSNNDLEGALVFAAAIRSLPIQKTQCVIYLLIQHGADVNYCDEFGWTCLHYACHANNLRLLPFLLNSGALVTRDVYGFLPQDYVENLDTRNLDICALVEKTKITEYSLRVPQQQESGTSIIVHYTKPEDCTNSGYIQLVYYQSKESLPSELFFGDHVNIPLTQREDKGESFVVFETLNLPQPIICRFLYVHSDKGKMTRRVVASSSTVSVKTGISRYSFTVNRLPFYHSFPLLHGKEFSSTQDFRNFMEKHSLSVDFLKHSKKTENDQEKDNNQEKQQIVPVNDNRSQE